MKIGINITGVGEIVGGTSVYTRGLMGGLQQAAPEVAVATFAYRRRFSRDRRVLRSVDTLWHQGVWLHWGLPRQLRAGGVDLLHNPGTHIPLRCPVPLVATVHDLYTIRNPAAFPGWHRRSSRFFIRQTLRRADRIIAVSEFTRREILDVFGSAYDAKIRVVHEAADARFRPPSADARAAAAETYGLRGPYLLCVSTIEPRKNLERTLRAFARVRDRVPHRLLIAGKVGWKQERLRAWIAELGLDDRVRLLGYVPDDDLPALYGQADLFLYPSLYEGFGLPILVAMGCGCPVLTSDAGSMPEVAGGAAVLADPLRVDDLAEKLEGILHDDGARAGLARAGPARAAEFSWGRCARESVAVYQSVL